jgi:hypothetical protein
MGDEGTLQISEDPQKCRVYAEGHLPLDAWDKWAAKGYLVKMPPKEDAAVDEADAIVSVYKSRPPVTWLLPVDLEASYHLPHLENFFAAVRGESKLNCPPEVGYETAATVLAVNRAVEAGKRLDLSAEDFKA